MKGGPRKRARTAPTLMGNVGFNFFAFFAGKGASAVVGIFLIRILGPEGAGFYTAALGFAFVFAIIADLGLPGYVTREVSQARDRIQGIFSRALLIQAVQVVVASVVMAVSVLFGAAGQVPAPLVALAFAGLALAIMTVPTSAGLQGREEFRAVALVSSACSWMNAIAVLAVALVAPSPFNALAGWAASNAAGLVLWLWAGRRNGLAFRRPAPLNAWGFWRGAFPFAMTGITNQLYVRQGMVLLTWMASVFALGLYGAAARMSELLQLILLSLSGPLYPRLGFLARGVTSSGLPGPAARESIGKVLTRALRYLGAVCFPVGVGGTVLATPLMLLLFGREFGGAGPAFAWLVWVAALSGAHCGMLHALNALHRARWVAVMFGFNAVFSLAINLVFIPRYGIMAVAMAAALCEVVVMVASLFLLKGRCGIPVGLKRWLWPSVPASLLMAVVLRFLPAPSGMAVLADVAIGAAAYLGFLIVLGFFGYEERVHLRRFAGRLGLLRA